VASFKMILGVNYHPVLLSLFLMLRLTGKSIMGSIFSEIMKRFGFLLHMIPTK